MNTMYIDSKLAQFRSFLTDSRLGSESAQTKLDKSHVSGTEQKSVSMQLSAQEKSSGHDRSKKQIRQSEKIEEEGEQKKNEKSADEIEADKKINLKLLNLL